MLSALLPTTTVVCIFMSGLLMVANWELLYAMMRRCRRRRQRLDEKIFVFSHLFVMMPTELRVVFCAATPQRIFLNIFQQCWASTTTKTNQQTIPHTNVGLTAIWIGCSIMGDDGGRGAQQTTYILSHPRNVWWTLKTNTSNSLYLNTFFFTRTS